MAAVSSIRLYSDQIERLKRSKKFVDVIDCAIARYKAGEFQLVFRDNESSKEVLEPVSVRRQFSYSGKEIRAILDGHFRTPRKKLEQDLEKATKEVDALMAFYTKQDYIIDNRET